MIRDSSAMHTDWNVRRGGGAGGRGGEDGEGIEVEEEDRRI